MSKLFAMFISGGRSTFADLLLFHGLAKMVFTVNFGANKKTLLDLDE